MSYFDVITLHSPGEDGTRDGEGLERMCMRKRDMEGKSAIKSEMKKR